MPDFINAGESILTSEELINHIKWDGLRARIRRPPRMASQSKVVRPEQFITTRAQLRNIGTPDTAEESQRMSALVRLLEYTTVFWRFCSDQNVYPLRLWEWAVNTILDHDAAAD